MAAGISDHFTKASSGTRPTPTTLTATLSSGASPGTATCAALTGWPTDTAAHFIVYTTSATGAKVAGSQCDFKGIVSGSTITNLVLKAGTNTGYSVGAVVEASPTAAWADDMASGALVSMDQDGTLKAGAVDVAAVITDGVVTETKLADNSVDSRAYVDNSIDPEHLATNTITLGSTSLTANSAGYTGGVAQVTGFTVTVTIPAGGRKIEVEAYCGNIGMAAAGTPALSIWDGTVGSGTRVAQGEQSAANSGNLHIVTKTPPMTVAAGSKTYNVGLSTSASTATIGASATQPAYIVVRVV